MLWALRARARAERCPSRTDATVVDQRSTSWKQPIVRRGLDYKYSAAFGCLCDGGSAVRVQRVEQSRPASDQHGAAVGRLTELPSEPHHPYLWGHGAVVSACTLWASLPAKSPSRGTRSWALS